MRLDGFFTIIACLFMMLSRIALLFFILLNSATHVVAQANVRESGATQPDAVQPAASNFSYEIQIMQAEIQALRGQLEQQSFEIKRLKQQRLDDYLDLDKRVSELASKPSNPPASEESTSDGVPPLTTGIQLAGNQAEAKALYDEAIDLLLNKQDYTAAGDKFDQYLTRYPDGRFTPNIYYWKGQISLANAKKPEATTLFEQLIEDYPQHSKTPDAKFKLARIYFEDGKKQEAQKLLEHVAAGDSDAALLAKSFLAKNYSQ